MSGREKNKPFANPFGTLKGFRLSGEPKERPALPAEPKPVQEPEAEALFRQEMTRLGVAGNRPPTDAGDAEAPPKEEPTAPPVDDRELFLAALGEMDTLFQDATPPPEGPPAVPRRMKLVRQGKLTPEATLDLHGCDRQQAREKVQNFLANAIWQGKKTVLIITGRGLGSGGEPVLRREVERLLGEGAGAGVAEWGRAPGRYGGEGALVVFLRGERR